MRGLHLPPLCVHVRRKLHELRIRSCGCTLCCKARLLRDQIGRKGELKPKHTEKRLSSLPRTLSLGSWISEPTLHGISSEMSLSIKASYRLTGGMAAG